MIEIPTISIIDAKHTKDETYCSIYAASVMEKHFKMEIMLMKDLNKGFASRYS